jgi:hypothetical protein
VTDTKFPERVREHESPHIRHTDLQTLDALLRIEEVLEKLRVDFLRTRREQIIEETAKPAPVDAATLNLKPAPATRKNPRSL